MGAETALRVPAFGWAVLRFLAPYQECVAKGAWARLVF